MFHKNIYLIDIIAIIVCCAYAVAAYQGVVQISAAGASLDSDLGIYASASALEDFPENFAYDPIAGAHSHSFGNMERILGRWAAPDHQYGLGLLRIGGVAVALFYAGYYFLGRWLFGSPGLAGILSAVMGISCWVGWGTFWGVVNSDPVPRVLFSGLFPFLLMGGIAALSRPWARPLVMLAAGLCVWVHNISALATGAMLFMAFVLNKGDMSWRRHSGILATCLVVFFVPVLHMIWPLLVQHQPLSQDDLQIFRTLFDVRFGADYGNLTDGLKNYLWHYTVLVPLFPLACVGWSLVMSGRFPTGAKVRKLAGMYPGMLLALGVIAACAIAEFRWAALAGHLSLGQDLIRGTRFLIPLAWLMIVAGLSCFWARIAASLRMLIASGLIVAIVMLNEGSWNKGAHYTLREAGLISSVDEKIDQQLQKNMLRREALEVLRDMSRPGDVIMSDNGEPGIRFVSLRGLFYSFKDGLYPYYAKNRQAACQWLQVTAAMRRDDMAYIDVWHGSGLRWLLCSRPQDREQLAAYGTIVWSNADWLIIRRFEQ